ncbi:MAG TPA: sugar ABC transporter ATP-binding protein [Acetobacteraceae bacterium]|nr:sugar ABC transporter ATP-binding protein [Acetobacteraceae bacterium]
MTPPPLKLSGITKSFGGVMALQDVHLSLRPGEIHGLVGENGAGKSTLMKIIAGVHPDYHGETRVDGQQVRFASPRDARAAGIGMVHQELSAVRDLSVAENVYLGMQPVNRFGLIDWREMRRGAAEHLQSLGIELDPRMPMGALPLGLQQLVEIARVLFSGARIIILDEPTSALSPPEVERLFGLLGRLRAAERSIVFISHFIDDVLAICDRVTVLRNGRAIATEPCAGVDKRWVIDSMIGAGHAELEESYLSDIRLQSRRDAPVVLSLEGLSRTGAYHDVSLHVHAGEILGIYGFLGAGQVELARTLFGRLIAERGHIVLGGKPLRLSSTARARRAGIAFLPEDRHMMLFTAEPVFKNMTIAILDRINRIWLRPKVERNIAECHVSRMRIRPPQVGRQLGTLSGGNQQKVALAKWLTHLPRVLVLSEPTRGMDVGAKQDVVNIVRGLRDRGVAIVVVSTEPETVLSLGDRIVVMRKGGVVREFANEPVSKDRLLEAA